MSITRHLQRAWTTVAAVGSGSTPHDTVGAVVTTEHAHGAPVAGYVTVFTDTPEFPEAERDGQPPAAFESTYVHLDPQKARELGRYLIALADRLETAIPLR